MARNESYTGSIDLISGIRPKNGGNFPLVDAHDVQTREDGTRLDAELALIWAKLKEIIENGGGGNTSASMTVGKMEAMLVSEAENRLVSEVEA